MPADGHARDPEHQPGRRARRTTTTCRAREAGQGRASGAEVDIAERIRALRAEMFAAAENLEFEKAARLRDELKRLEGLAGKDGVALDSGAVYDPYAGGTKKAKTRCSRGASSSNNAASKAKASGGGRGRFKR